MRINDRLKLLGDMIPSNTSIIDVGCDHAFLDIYLVNSNRGIKCVASDITEGPVNAAKQNIKDEGLEDKIEVRMGDGLDSYTPDIDTVVISGMGGLNMIGIFKRNLNVLKTVKYIVISPNNYQEDIKRFLIKNGFCINDEKLVKDKKHIYQIIKLEKGKCKYSKKELFMGPVLIKEKGKLFDEYFGRELKSREITLQMLPKKYHFKRIKVNKEIKMLKSELK